MQRLVLAVFTASLGLTAPLHAQHPAPVRPPSARWVINGHSTAALGTSVGDEFGSLETSAGLGAGVEVGYMVTPRLLAYAGVDIAKQAVDVVGLDGNFGLSHLEAGARLNFPIARSKLLPYVGVSYGVLAIAVLGAGLVFGIWPRGSWLALLALTLPFVLASLAIGVLVSALARSSAQAVFISVFFILPSMILSGVLLPYQLMPDGVREFGAILPLRWYQIGLRRVVSRGGGLEDVWLPILALTGIFAALLLLVRWRLKPRLG